MIKIKKNSFLVKAVLSLVYHKVREIELLEKIILITP